MDFKFGTKSGRLTEQRKRDLRAFAKFRLGLKKNAPLKKVLEQLPLEDGELTEEQFYPFMEQFIEAEVRKIALDMKKKELKKQKNNEKRKIIRKQKKVKTPPPVYFTYNPPDSFEAWRDIMAQHSGQNITMSYILSDNMIGETHEYSIPVEFAEFRKYCKNLWFGTHDWRATSDETIFEGNGFTGQLVVLIATNINNLNETINQIFRDGPTNCLLTPIKNWIQEKLDNSKSKKTTERYITLNNKVTTLLEQYPNGVPRDDIKHISNNLNITISIELPFQKEPFILEKPDTKSLTTFKYLNSSHNHVDEITDLTKFTECTQEELSSKIKEYDDNKINYYFTMNNRNINKIYVNGEIFGLSPSYYKFITDFENEYNINSWKIDAVQHPEITKFLENSCHYNCCMDFQTPSLESEIVHIDQQACYKNFYECRYFMGFLSKITDFRVTNKIQGIGIYQITNINITNEKFKRYNDFMKLYVNFNNYPSPSLEFLDSVGTYDIIGGCWGIDGELNMDFINEDGLSFMNKDAGVPFYSKYIGLCNSINYTKKYYFHGTEEIAQIIRQNTDCEVLRYGVNLFNNNDDNKNALTSVSTKKKHVWHLSHLTAFILDYAKLNIIEQLMEMPFDSIVRVNSDGIYFMPWYILPQPKKNEDIPKEDEDKSIPKYVFYIPEEDGSFSKYENNAWVDSERRIKFYSESLKLKNNYVEKPSKAYNNDTGKFTTYSSSTYFCSNTLYNNISYNFGKYRDFYKTELAVGGGGSGKTHFNLTDTGSVNVMYVAPSWKLARNKSSEYKCNVATHASLLMCDPTNTSFSYSSTLLIDEVSMLSNESKEKIIDFYGASYKLIFCGDIKYQLPYIPDKKKVQTEINNYGFDNIMTFSTDYRATCDKLKELKQEARELIDYGEGMTPNSLLDKLQKISSADLEKTYNIEDMILCQFHKQKDKYTEQFTGKFTNEKYYITETSIKYSCGDIIITNEIIEKQFKPEIRHSFTVHSIQGETCHTKLFIHRDRMTLRMFYTAISRAKKYDQIYLIE